MFKTFKDIKGFSQIFDQMQVPRRIGSEAADTQEKRAASRMASLLEAVCEQAAALQSEQERASAAAKQELGLLTGRMAMLAPLCAANVETLVLNETTIEDLTRDRDELRGKLEAAEADIAHYRPLSLRLEEELRVDRTELEEARRGNLKLTEDVEKVGAENRVLAHRSAGFEAKWQRSMEESEALHQKIEEKERAIEKLNRETMLLQSDFAMHISDLERRDADIAMLNRELNSLREENLAQRDSLKSFKSDMAKLRHEMKAQARELGASLTGVREQLANREKHVIELENANIALGSKVDFFTRSHERQREDVSRHLSHIGQLEASNRHLLDALSRSAMAEEGSGLDQRMHGHDRRKKGQARLRSVQTEGDQSSVVA